MRKSPFLLLKLSFIFSYVDLRTLISLSVKPLNSICIDLRMDSESFLTTIPTLTLNVELNNFDSSSFKALKDLVDKF